MPRLLSHTRGYEFIVNIENIILVLLTKITSLFDGSSDDDYVPLNDGFSFTGHGSSQNNYPTYENENKELKKPPGRLRRLLGMLNKLPGKVFALLKQDSKTIAEDLKSLVKYLYSKFCYYFKLLKTPKTLWLHIKLGAKVRFQKAKQFVLGIPYYVKHIPHHVKVFIGKVKIFVPQIPAKLKTFAQKLKGSSRTRTRFAGSLLFTLIAVTLFRFFFLSGAEAAWFDDHWTFRRKMTITNNGSSTSDKKVMFDIDTASIIAEGKMQADGGDIRVTDQRGKLLPYYYDDEGGLTGTAAEEILRDGSGPYAIDDAGDPGTLPGSARQIVQTSTGTLYAFVNDGGSCEVWMSVTGNSWAEQDSANNPACASDTYISVAVGTADTLHILYMANSSTFSYIAFNTSTNLFGSAETIDTPTGTDGTETGSIAVDSNDQPHVVYYTTGSTESTQTEYFNSYATGEAWSCSPENMVDGSTTTYARSNDDFCINTIQLNDGNTNDGTDLGTITKVEIRGHGWADSNHKDMILRPVFGGTSDGSNHSFRLAYDDSADATWSTYFDITTDTNAPGTWTWSEVQILEIDVENEDGSILTMQYMSKVEIRVTYISSNDNDVIYSNRVSGETAGTWDKTPVTVEECTSDCKYMDIVINEDNIPEITYINTNDSDLSAAVGNVNNATSFGTPYDVDASVNTTSGEALTSIGVDQAGNTWIAYIDEDGADDYVNLALHMDGSGWTSWNPPIETTNVGYEPSIAIITSDIYVFYQDDSTDQKIVYNKYDSGDSTWSGETTLETPGSGVDYQDVHARWSYLNNNDGYLIDYLYSDGTDVYWNYLDARPVNIDTANNIGTNFSKGGRTLLRTADGTLYAVLSDSANTVVEVWMSEDGTTWAEQDSDNSPAINLMFSAAMDSANDIHIAYANSDSPSDLAYVKFTTSSNTFGTPEDIASGGSGIALWSPSITVDSNDVPHAAWGYVDSGGPDYIRYGNRIGGAPWSSVDIESTMLRLGDITINEDDIPEVTYVNQTDNDLTAAVGNAADAASFTVYDIDTDVDDTNDYSPGASIAVDQEGNTWIAYIDADYDVALAKHNDSEAWTIWTTYTDKTNDGLHTSISINNSDIYVFYEAADAGVEYMPAYDVFDSRESALSWAGETIIDSTETGGYKGMSAKWSMNANNFGTNRIDYLFSDSASKETFWSFINLRRMPSKVDDDSDFLYVSGESRTLVRTSDGSLYFVVDESLSIEIWKSTDEGNSWSEQDSGNKPTASLSIQGPSMAIDSHNILHIAYVYNSGSGNYLSYITFDTSNDQFASSSENVDTTNIPNDGPAITIDSNDVPHIAYEQIPADPSYVNKVGGSWNSPIILEDIPASIDDFDIAINEDDYPEISYINADDSDLTAAAADRNNPTLQSHFTLHDIDTNVTAISSNDTSTAIDSSGNTWIAYVDENGADDYISLAYHPDIQTDWSADWIVYQTGNIGSEPSLVAEGTDLYLFYEDDNGDVVYDVFDGTTAMDTAVNIDDEGDPGVLPGSGQQIVRASDGTLYAGINDGGSCEIWKSTDGQTWVEQDSSNSIICNSSAPFKNFSVAIDGTGDLHLAYGSTTANVHTLLYGTFSTSTNTFGPTLGETIDTYASIFYITDFDIAVDANDIPHTVDSRFVFAGNEQTLRYNNRIGGSWLGSGGVEVEDLPRWAHSLSIVINEDNIPELSYVNDSLLTTGVGDDNDPDEAGQWTLYDVDTAVSSRNKVFNDWGSSSSIRVDQEGNSWIAYEDSDDTISIVKHNDGDAWGTWQTIQTTTDTAYQPSMTIYKNLMYVLYEDENDDIVYQIYNGSDWSGETVLESGTYESPKFKSSNFNDHQRQAQLDYIFSDGTDVYYNYIPNGFDGEKVLEQGVDMQDVKTRWSYINNYDSTGTARVQTNSYYFNAYDDSERWTNTGNAFDGDTSTYAYETSSLSNYLDGAGTTAPTSGGTIQSVKARFYGKSGGAVDYLTTATIYSDAVSLGSRTAPTTDGWTSYITLSTPTGGWTWNKINSLTTRIVYTASDPGSEGRAYKVEIFVASTNTDAQAEIDYLYSDNTDVWYNRLLLDTETQLCTDACLWVLPDKIPSGDSNLYMYYGNPSAQNKSEAADFSEEELGSYTYTEGSEEIGPGPTMVLKFDEGYGTTSQDSTLFNNDATVSTGPPTYPTIEKQINIMDQEYSTAGGGDPGDNSLGLIYWDADAYSGEEVYFEAVIRCDSCTGGNTEVDVNLANDVGTDVSGSTVSTTSSGYTRVRTASAITLVDDEEYTIEITRDATGGTAYVGAARLIIIQSGVPFTDTETQIEIGANFSTTSDTANTLSEPKSYRYVAGAFNDGTVDSYFEATLKSTTSPGNTLNVGVTYPATVTSYADVTNGYDDEDWVTVTEVATDNGTYANITSQQFDAPDYTYVIRARNFPFSTSIPNDATIKGVEITIERHYEDDGVSDALIQLVNNNIGSEADRIGNNKSTGTAWLATDGTGIYGSSTDTWGASLTPTIVNSSNFGVDVASQATGSNAEAFIDYIRMDVWYEEAPVGTAYAQLWQTPSGTVDTVSVTSGSWTRVRGGPLSTNWVEDRWYNLKLYSSDTGHTTYIANAKIVVQQTKGSTITNTEAVHQYNPLVVSYTGDSYADIGYANQYNANNFTNGTYEAYFNSTLKSSSLASNTADSTLNYVGAVGEISNHLENYGGKISGNISAYLPAFGTEEIDVQLQSSTAGVASYSSGSTLVIRSSSISDEAPPDPLWQKEGMCVSGNCLFFDGTYDVATVTSSDYVDLSDHLVGGFTYSFWVKPISKGESSASEIFQKGTSTFARIVNEGSGDTSYIDLDVSLDLTSSDAIGTFSDALKLHEWNHVAISYTDDAGDEATVYVNGEDLGSTSGGSGAPATDTNNLLIGGSSSNNFHGFIDEFSIHPRELASDVITAMYNSGQAGISAGSEGTTAVLGTSKDTLSSGLVGYWPMDDTEIYPHSCTFNSGVEGVCDASGNSVHGNANGSMVNADLVKGKFTTALDLDGNDDYLSMTDTDAHSFVDGTQDKPFSVAAWVYFTQVEADTIISKGSSSSSEYKLDIGQSNDLSMRIFDSGGDYIGKTSYPFSMEGEENRWVHVAAAYDGSKNSDGIRLFIDGQEVATSNDNDGTYSNMTNSSSGLVIGRRFTDGAAYSNYIIDEVRLYNRALSSSEVDDLFNWAPGPVAYWDFNENSDTTYVYDRSGNGYTGTMGGAMTEDDWVIGKHGTALNFDGDNDHISVPDDGGFNFIYKNWTLEAWINRDVITSGQETLISHFNEEMPDGGYKLYMESDGDITCAVTEDEEWFDTTTTTAASYDDGQWHHITCTYDAYVELAIYIDGIKTSSHTSFESGPAGVNNDDFYIGANFDGTTDAFEGMIDEVKFYKYMRSQQQIIQDMNAGHPAPGSPVGSAIGHWKFEEGYGDTAIDSSPQENNGDLGGLGSCPGAGNCPTRTNKGKFGKALDFDGGDVFIISDDDLYDFTDTEDVTISGWFNRDTFSSDHIIMHKLDSFDPLGDAGYVLYIDGDTDKLTFAISDATPDEFELESSTTFTSAGWHHFAVVWDQDSTTNSEIYIDGKADNATDTGTIGDIGDTSNAFDVYIGQDGEAAEAFDGRLDDIRFYNSAFTSSQVALLYNQAASAVLGAVGTDESGNTSYSADRTYCPPGDTTASCAPIAELKLDENKGTNAYDTAGGGYNGTLGAGDSAPSWSIGKHGPALDFDGTNDYVDIGTGPTSVKTIEFWTNPDTTTEYFVNLTSTTDYVWASSGTVTATGLDTPTIYVDGIATDTLVAGKWQHVVVTTDTAENASNFDIGRTQNTNYMEGLIDNVKLYDYALSQSQAAWNCDRGKPLTRYKFDECEGAVAYDTSGRGTHATITIGASGDNTSAGTCSSEDGTEAWNNGTVGRFNYSLDFDGSDDYVSAPDTDLHTFGDGSNDRPFSITGWVNMDNATDFVIAGKGNTADTEYLLTTNGSDQLKLWLYDDVSSVYIGKTSTLALTSYEDTWTHVAVTYDGTEDTSGITMYVNGKAVSTSNNTNGSYTAMNNEASGLSIAREFSDGTNYANGSIDDLKIYNYQMTSQQIQADYNQGGPIRFGPASGAP